MLSVVNLSSGYDGTNVLEAVDVSVGPGEVAAVLGSNGAGKSTLLKTISGLVRAARGTISLDDANIVGVSARQIVRLGIAHVPEGRRIFSGLSVLENLHMGGFTVRDKARFNANLTMVFDLFPRLAERRSQSGVTLSGGEQQMLSIARALMSSPKFLLLDEPSMGLAPVIVERLFDSLKILRGRGLGILLVEQNAHIAMDVADRFVVLSQGKVVRRGTRQDAVSSEDLIADYLAS